MCDRFKAVSRCDFILKRLRKALIDFDDLGALGANEVMMVPIVAFSQQFEARPAVAKMKPFHHPHFFQEMHRAIDGGQITFSFGQGLEYFPDAQGMGVAPEDFQNRLARASHFARLPPEPLGQSIDPRFFPLNSPIHE